MKPGVRLPQSPKPATDVTVLNTAANPVPVTAAQSGPWTIGIDGTVPVAPQGTTNVAGSVAITNNPAVTLSGTPTVKIDPTSPVAVVSADKTVLLSDSVFDYVDERALASPQIDVSGFGTIRVKATANCDAAGGGISVRTLHGNTDDILDSVSAGGQVLLNKTYDVPGTRVYVILSCASSDIEPPSSSVTIWGRP